MLFAKTWTFWTLLGVKDSCITPASPSTQIIPIFRQLPTQKSKRTQCKNTYSSLEAAAITNMAQFLFILSQMKKIFRKNSRLAKSMLTQNIAVAQYPTRRSRN